jgi:putative nucleotide binding protein
MTDDADAAPDAGVGAVVLDFLAHGRSDDDRSRYQRSPVAYAVDASTFALYELRLAEDADISIADRIVIEGEGRTEGIEEANRIDYEDLSGGAQSELEYVVEDLVADEPERFVDFYNEAGPITLRLHQLNLLPGIGKKLRNNILDERKREPFESFEDLEERISGLHDPDGVLVERVLEEIREEDLKYRIFATEQSEAGADE